MEWIQAQWGDLAATISQEATAPEVYHEICCGTFQMPYQEGWAAAATLCSHWSNQALDLDSGCFATYGSVLSTSEFFNSVNPKSTYLSTND